MVSPAGVGGRTGGKAPANSGSKETKTRTSNRLFNIGKSESGLRMNGNFKLHGSRPVAVHRMDTFNRTNVVSPAIGIVILNVPSP